MHGLLALLWLNSANPRLETDEVLERVFMLVPSPRAQAPSMPRRATVRANAAQRTQTAPAAASRAVDAAMNAVQAEQSAPDPSVEPYDDPLAEPRTPADAGIAAQARRLAGATDHDLRKGKLAPLEPSDTRWERFAEHLEAARKDSSRTLMSETYTTPDGVTIYRFRRGNKVYCRTSGSARPVPSTLDYVRDQGGAVQFDRGGGEGSAGLVACPKHAVFKRE